MYTLDFWNLPGILALISGFLVVGQLILTLFHGGIDTDLDVDGDGFGDFDLGAILSPKGILHFVFGASWYLVLIQPYRPDRNWFAYDWFIAIGVGVLVSFFVVLLYWSLSKLACEKKKEQGEELVGRSVSIYLNSGGGNYDATVVSSGMTTIIQVKSVSGKTDYRTGEWVELVKYENGIYFIN